MSEREQGTAEDRPNTDPPEATHEATHPPGNGELDQDAVEKGQDKLDQAGAGH